MALFARQLQRATHSGSDGVLTSCDTCARYVAGGVKPFEQGQGRVGQPSAVSWPRPQPSRPGGKHVGEAERPRSLSGNKSDFESPPTWPEEAAAAPQRQPGRYIYHEGKRIYSDVGLFPMLGYCVI